DAKLLRLAFTGPLRPRDRRIEIVHHLAILHLGHDLREDLLDVGELRYVPLPRVELGRNGEVSVLRPTTADVLDVLVNAEDLLHDEDDWRPSSRRRFCPVRGNRPIRNWDLHVAGHEPSRIGGDRFRSYRTHREGKPC